MGHGFERFKLEIPLDADSSEAVIDLAALKIPPGDYRIAFYGGAVAKYRYNVDAVHRAEADLKDAEQELADTQAELSRLTQQLTDATEEMKEPLRSSLDSLTSKQKEMSGRVKAAEQHLKQVTAQAQPKDIVDIVVSQPIEIRVKAAEK
jgi:septal ring factor EnvC (AmiA/AmiB activator)